MAQDSGATLTAAKVTLSFARTLDPRPFGPAPVVGGSTPPTEGQLFPRGVR